VFDFSSKIDVIIVQSELNLYDLTVVEKIDVEMKLNKFVIRLHKGAIMCLLIELDKTNILA